MVDFETETYQPTRLEMAVSVLAGTGESDTKSAIVAYSLRLPISEMAYVDALATNAGISRNKVLCMLIDVAMPTVLEAMPPKVRKTVEKLAVKELQKLLGDGDLPQAEKGEC